MTYGIENAIGRDGEKYSLRAFRRNCFSTLKLPNGSAEVLFPLNGRHNISNALAASAVGFSFRNDGARKSPHALQTVAPPPQRGEVLHFAEGFTVINDSYNSNPDALLSMVKTLAEGGASAKRKIVVAGEMRELGRKTRRKFILKPAKESPKSALINSVGVEGFAKDLVEGAKTIKRSRNRILRKFRNRGRKFCQTKLQAGDLILVKGSRGVRTEKVIEKLLEKFEMERNK